MTSEVDIGNLALDGIGSRSTISSFNENSAEARAISRHYAVCRDEILSAAHWNFARKQVALTLLRDATATPPDTVPQPWLYEYAYPSDCVQARYILPQLQAGEVSGANAPAIPEWVGAPVRFLISSDNDNSGNQIVVILTNQVQAGLVYTSRVTNPQLFDASFVQALAALIASRIAIALTGDKQLARDKFSIADQLTKSARANNGNEGLTTVDSLPDWIRVRGYATDFAYPDGSFWSVQPQNLVQIS